MIPRGSTGATGNLATTGVTTSNENRLLFQDTNRQQLAARRRISPPLSIGGGSSNSLGNQRISPTFRGSNNNHNAVLSLSGNTTFGMKNNIGGMMEGNHNNNNNHHGLLLYGNNNDTSTFKAGGLFGGNNDSSSSMLKGANKRKRTFSHDNNSKKSETLSSLNDDPSLLQRLNSMSGGFPMPKWARKAAAATATGSNHANNNDKFTLNDDDGINSGMGRSERKGMSIHEMMKEKKRLEAERVNNMRGSFPLPKMMIEEGTGVTTTTTTTTSIRSLDTFRQVWLQTPPEYQKEVFSRRLEKGNILIPNRNRQMAMALDDDDDDGLS